MKTKTIIIGQESREVRKPKPIKLEMFLGKIKNEFDKDCSPANTWNYLELICSRYDTNNLDLIFAYNDPKRREDGYLYLGNWNDGIVE